MPKKAAPKKTAQPPKKAAPAVVFRVLDTSLEEDEDPELSHLVCEEAQKLFDTLDKKEAAQFVQLQRAAAGEIRPPRKPVEKKVKGSSPTKKKKPAKQAAPSPKKKAAKKTPAPTSKKKSAPKKGAGGLFASNDDMWAEE